MSLRTSQGFTQTKNPFGQAQSQQGPSFGTPYNPQQGSNFSAWNPQQYQQSMAPGGGAYNTGVSPDQWNAGQSAWAMPKQQLLGWGAQAQGATPISGLPAMNQFGPMQSQDIGSIMQQRQALVQQINDSQARQPVGTWLGEGAPPDNWGQQQFNPQQMWNNASQMVSQGWQNPFASQVSQQQSPPRRPLAFEQTDRLGPGGKITNGSLMELFRGPIEQTPRLGPSDRPVAGGPQPAWLSPGVQLGSERTPIALAPPVPPPPGAMGQPPRPTVRDTVRQQAAGSLGARPSAPGMPLGMPASMRPYWEAAQSMPGMTTDQQQQAAWQMKNQQEMASRDNARQSQQAALGQWQAEQQAIGQSLNPRNPYRSEAERVAAQRPMMLAQQRRQQSQRLAASRRR